MIRRARQTDTQEIYEILNSTMELRDFDEGEEYPISWVENAIGSKENIVLIYEINDELAGFLIGLLVKDIKESIRNNTYVKPKFRNKGTATKLIKEYERILKEKGFEFIISFVNIENKKMQNINDKLNYAKGNK